MANSVQQECATAHRRRYIHVCFRVTINNDNNSRPETILLSSAASLVETGHLSRDNVIPSITSRGSGART